MIDFDSMASRYNRQNGLATCMQVQTYYRQNAFSRFSYEYGIAVTFNS